MYTVEKDGIIWELRDEIQLSAFLNNGYKIVEEDKKKNKK